MYTAPLGKGTSEDIYVCDVCNRAYHWPCLLRLGCCRDEDRESG